MRPSKLTSSPKDEGIGPEIEPPPILISMRLSEKDDNSGGIVPDILFHPDH